MVNKKSCLTNQENFSIIDNTIVHLIVEKTKLNKEKYSLILSKTLIVFIIIVALAFLSTTFNIISKQIMISLLIIGAVLYFLTYLYVIDHFDKVDRDLDEVITLLQTKSISSSNQIGSNSKKVFGKK
jgi:hypothetical protein